MQVILLALAKLKEMKLSIETSIVIHSNPDKVWAVLTDFENYREWNPFVKSIVGSGVPGEKLKVEIEDMKFSPVVLIFDENKEFRWKGKLIFKGLFDGEHYFKLIDNGDGTTTFIHGENFSGVLVYPFKNKLLTQTKAGFESMNENLKKEVERKGSENIALS